ncbi:MAG TPA: response regulator transcription factor [Alphaproteobacteria bacterium]|jgi:DNA-binding NarL/FixJ family response regulator
MRFLFADDHWISRAGLRHLVELTGHDVKIVEATSFAEAEAALASAAFDLCLLDTAMPEAAPLEGLRRLRAAAPAVPIIVITMAPTRRLVLRSIEAGAQGFVLKTASAEEIRGAIDRVLGGEVVLPSQLAGLPAELRPEPAEAEGYPIHGDAHDPRTLLTPRQRQVLDLIAMGKRNADIAADLDISPRTVQIHVSTIFKLLNVGNRTEAALLARRHQTGQHLR